MTHPTLSPFTVNVRDSFPATVQQKQGANADTLRWQEELKTVLLKILVRQQVGSQNRAVQDASQTHR